jgi:hypothetical protein
MPKVLHHIFKSKSYLLIMLLFLFGVAQAQVPDAPTNLVVTPINTGV